LYACVAVPDPLLDILQRYWGYAQFRPGQREAMDAVVQGRDSLLVLPTGGGKSLCFQAPALIRPGVALVISPLISLMKDQVDTLTANGVPAAYLNSAMAPEDRRQVMQGLRERRYRLLYVAPERIAGDGSTFLPWLHETCGLSFVAVDEAHCISHWGHDFRPEYRQIGALRQGLPGVSLHAFTATATARVRDDIVAQLGLQDPVTLVGSFDRANLLYRVLPRNSMATQIRQVLARHRGEAGIIYCPTRREVDALAASLAEEGYRVRPYHAGLTDEERHAHQDAFLNESVDIVVATVAFGMGIDRSDVRFVIHAGAPQSLEHYQQEAGRAGRDGLEAECVLIVSSGDFLRWRDILSKNGDLTEARQGLLRDMERYAASVGCRHRRLVSYFGEAYSKPDCGACDYCLGELESVPDPATLARKILSAVARVGQRYGAAHVGQVLRGQLSEAVRSRGHDTLSVFGLLRDVSVDDLRGYTDQLLAFGLLRQVGDPYPVLQLTDAGAAGLRDAAALDSLSLARQRKPEKGSGPKKSRVEAESWAGVDRVLFDQLRAMRQRLARERGVPPYVIFHDTTLRELARLKPTSVSALRDVYGVGARKADDLGPEVLRVLHGG
jgi:ATP-dependent DNA helicase RecQ